MSLICSKYTKEFKDMKHILPLTYEPKIPDVRNGKCTQTIRPISYTKSKQVNDLVMFHGWSGKPYRSKWSFRTPYWEIKCVFDIVFTYNGIKKANAYDEFIELSSKDIDEIAVLDGFKNIKEMMIEFYEMYGEKLYDMVFSVIRWKYKEREG